MPKSLDTANRRPLIFFAVGILNTLLDFTFYTLLTLVFFRDQHLIIIVGLISGTFALICAFITHSLLTWRDHPIDKCTMLRFVVFTGFGMWVLRPLLLMLFVQLTPIYAFSEHLLRAMNLQLTQAFVANTGTFGFMAILLLIYNYFVYSHFVFKKAPGHSG